MAAPREIRWQDLVVGRTYIAANRNRNDFTVFEFRGVEMEGFAPLGQGQYGYIQAEPGSRVHGTMVLTRPDRGYHSTLFFEIENPQYYLHTVGIPHLRAILRERNAAEPAVVGPPPPPVRGPLALPPGPPRLERQNAVNPNVNGPPGPPTMLRQNTMNPNRPRMIRLNAIAPIPVQVHPTLEGARHIGTLRLNLPVLFEPDGEDPITSEDFVDGEELVRLHGSNHFIFKESTLQAMFDHGDYNNPLTRKTIKQEDIERFTYKFDPDAKTGGARKRTRRHKISRRRQTRR